MRTLTLLLLLMASTLAVSPQAGSRRDIGDKSSASSCEVVERALQETRSIKSGMTRREVEKHFKLDGGVQVRHETRYMYLGCHYIRVDVEFDLAAPTDRVEDSPNDVVTRVLRPYVAYPTMD